MAPGDAVTSICSGVLTFLVCSAVLRSQCVERPDWRLPGHELLGLRSLLPVDLRTGCAALARPGQLLCPLLEQPDVQVIIQ